MIGAVPDMHFLVTCEHARNAIPPQYAADFAAMRDTLRSHEGYDAGALELARDLARVLGAALIAGRASRLLVDLNRSLGHRDLFSSVSRGFSGDRRRQVVAAHYLPYRRAVESKLARWLAAGGRAVHFSSHSFTPVLHGIERNADLGLLYDPARPAETALCDAWIGVLAERLPRLRVRRNYPYTGISDGLTAALRRRFDGARYAGIEIEVNQRLVRSGAADWRRLRQSLAASLAETFRRNGVSGAGDSP